MSTKQLTQMALLTAVALVIFVLESYIPNPVPVPGVKLGLANIVTVYAIFALSPAQAAMIMLCRILLGSLLTGQVMGFIYSLAGGVLSFIAVLAMKKLVTENQIWAASVAGAIFHNVGQIIAAVAVTKTPSLFVYLPVLLVSGIITGLFTGLAAQFFIVRMRQM